MGSITHDVDGVSYRVLNLLYYVSRDRDLKDGGNLILYPNGMKKPGITVASRYNRLVLMETNDQSFHGVDVVKSDLPRRCISNYYFRTKSTVGHDYRHVTSFYSFPNEGFIKKLALRIDRELRQFLSSKIKRLVGYKVWHKRESGDESGQ